MVSVMQHGTLPINCFSMKLSKFPPLPEIKPIVHENAKVSKVHSQSHSGQGSWLGRRGNARIDRCPSAEMTNSDRGRIRRTYRGRQFREMRPVIFRLRNVQPQTPPNRNYGIPRTWFRKTITQVREHSALTYDVHTKMTNFDRGCIC